jgi:hypothetical protein
MGCFIATCISFYYLIDFPRLSSSSKVMSFCRKASSALRYILPEKATEGPLYGSRYTCSLLHISPVCSDLLIPIKLPLPNARDSNEEATWVRFSGLAGWRATGWRTRGLSVCCVALSG